MSLKLGSSGIIFGYNTNFDLSASTLLSLDITDPKGVTTSIATNRLSAPAIDGIFREGGINKTYLANQYIQFTTESTDFDTVIGTWKVCGAFTNDNTDPDQIYPGDTVSFRVEKSCRTAPV